MKNVLKWSGSILAVLVVIAAIWIGKFVYVTEYKITDIDTDISPNGQYSLQFQSVGEPDFPFGASHARIVLKKGRTIVAKTQVFDVENDGAILLKDNWNTEWKDDRVVVTIHGEEQEDARMVFCFDGRTE